MAGKVKTQLIIEGKNTAQGAFDQGARQLNTFSSQAKAAAGVLAGVFSVSVLSDFVRQSIDAADAAKKSASAVGLAIEEYTALQYAAKLAGVGTSELDASLSKFNRTIDAAAGGGKAQAEAFDRIGVSVLDAGGKLKTSDQILAETADKFQSMPDGIQKSALAMELFGRSGAKLIPLLNGGSAGLEELRKEAEALGVVISTETAAQAEVFNDNISRLGEASAGAGNQIAAEMLPALVDVSDLLVDLNKNTEASSIFASVLAGALKVLATAAIVVGVSFTSTGILIATAAAAAVAAAKGDFSEAREILAAGQREYVEQTAAALTRIGTLWSDAGEAAAATAVVQKEQQAIMAGDLKRATDAMGEQLKRQVKDAKAALAERVKAEREAAKQLEEAKQAQLDTEKRYADALAGLGTGAGDPSYGQAQALKVGAREALAGGDVEGAKRQAQAALEVLNKLGAAGESTYGFEGFIRELQAIEKSADQINVDNAQASLSKAEEDAKRLKTILDEATSAKVSVELPPAEVERIKGVMQALAAEISQGMVITPTVALPKAGEADAEGYVFVPNIPTPPGFAKGTNSAPPGMAWVGEQGPELVNFGGGEQVLTAAASQNLMARMAGLSIPDLSAGLGETAASAAPAMPNLGRIVFERDGQQAILYAEAGEALNLRRLANKFGHKK
ncbi:hypothetical protein OU997_05230 [Pseudomonas sp. SL4(2022)]|uniref:phage tail tape measure protein n=1 Tax=Pseudomonas sp. SL4(2022) TaxID=2994661 RepID=UPI00226D677E|nr:phage tail tape measure protein [Pseudomonas sp. SL4(2022)]WAC45575.1 hypothetical protein OU997_05230 [Pseudomonas sp. SL4(2022)]